MKTCLDNLTNENIAMWCGVVTMFPEMFEAITKFGMTNKAINNGLLNLEVINLRDFTTDSRATVDSRPYGGGPGMVMQFKPLVAAVEQLQSLAPSKPKVIYLSPQGTTIKQNMLQDLANSESSYIFIAGRYEGIDERVINAVVDEEWSIGDYVLTGGELPIMVTIDALTRLLPGVLGDSRSIDCESFTEDLLDYPHYTRPVKVADKAVPQVLLSGDHDAIRKWRGKQQIKRTYLRRSELLNNNKSLTNEQKQWLTECIAEADRN